MFVLGAQRAYQRSRKMDELDNSHVPKSDPHAHLSQRCSWRSVWKYRKSGCVVLQVAMHVPASQKSQESALMESRVAEAEADFDLLSVSQA